MSRHESVSCDSCMKANFRGRRYKCLICYDYDLCSTCYEAGVVTGRHTTEHAMQCILTRSEFDLYYGGDTMATDQLQSFTCPYCATMGYTESSLAEHVTSQHPDTSSEVICPICAALPGGDPNMVSDDFQAHLALDHRGRDGYENDPMGNHRGPRRLFPTRRGSRTRHMSNTGPAVSNASSIPMDPIAELLSHLSGVHTRLNMRTNPQQLRELQMTIEAERTLSSYREHIQRLPRRTGAIYELPSVTTPSSNNSSESSKSTSATTSTQVGSASASQNSKTLLSRYLEETKLTGKALEEQEKLNSEHSLFVQDILLATLADSNITLTETNKLLSSNTANSSLMLSLDSLLENVSKEIDVNSDTATDKPADDS